MLALGNSDKYVGRCRWSLFRPQVRSESEEFRLLAAPVEGEDDEGGDGEGGGDGQSEQAIEHGEVGAMFLTGLRGRLRWRGLGRKDFGITHI